MFLKIMLAVAAFASALGIGSGASLACACCAEPGQRFVGASRFGSDSLGAQTIGQLQPDGKAQLYTTVADWEEQIRGLNNPDKSERYTVKLERDDKTWALKFSDNKGNSGVVIIALPKTFTYFAVDTAPGALPASASLQLYKELRVKGVMHGLGMFALRTRGLVRAELIFHGRGNGCTSPDQFTHWTLDVNGPGARYRLYGRLSRKASQ